ncbi:MAG: VCBS repeat-containing protein, partial [Myxococcales bacterium]|nr:VCBS repeat-containing protein [Myxococcales bacterium]
MFGSHRLAAPTRPRRHGLAPSARWALPLALAATALILCPARAQTGVSDDRVSLPNGPGSLDGLGENVGVNANMGTMSWSVPVAVPAGFRGLTPSLDLTYSSGGGGSVVGMGWSLDSPSVERMTYRGLPRYTRDDDFAVAGSEQLVRLPGTDPPVYRARMEGGFVRWTWVAAGDGREGYWRAEYPDGRVGTFGARADGTLVPEARVGFAGGTFRYMLVEVVDTHGHRMVYDYAKFGAVALVQRVGWVYGGGETPRYAATFVYEERRDDTGFGYLSDAKGGFDELLTERLKTINILSGAERIRRYELSYEPYADSGGFTRLARVEQFGHDGGRYPVVFDFTYSKALGGLCDGGDCQRPFLVDMGSLGVDLGTRRATLLDMNGDALPDLVQTPLDGNHRIFFNASDGAGASAFSPTAVTSAVGTSAFVLGSGRSQVLDIDGDGFVDLLNTKNGEYLKNDGSGDWAAVMSVSSGGTDTLPDFESDFDPSEDDGLASIRFIDYDNDKKIDVVRATAVATSYYRNTGGGGFQTDDHGDDLGAGFVENNLELSDMNGDGLLDA